MAPSAIVALYIATIPASALVLAPWFFPGDPMRDSRGHHSNLVAVAVIVIVTSLVQWQRVEQWRAVAEPPSPRVEGAGASLILLTVLTLVAITVVPEFLTTQLGLRMLIDGRLMTAIVAVALAMHDPAATRADPTER